MTSVYQEYWSQSKDLGDPLLTSKNALLRFFKHNQGEQTLEHLRESQIY